MKSRGRTKDITTGVLIETLQHRYRADNIQ